MNNIQIIKRETIPPITNIEQGGVMHLLGELRDFSWSEPLRSFMQDGSGFSASWVQLAQREVLEPHTHPVLSMMVFYGGAGELIGDLQRPLVGDEVVVVPPGCLHGFIGGPPGLYALSIQFAQGLYSTPEKPRVVFSNPDESVDGLLALSEKRAAEFTKKPMFELFADGTLTSTAKRRAFLDALQIWVDGVEGVLLSRQASCSDPSFQSTFREHMRAFIAREGAKTGSRSSHGLGRDSALAAVTSWFAYQMYVLDNAEKAAIVYLVIEKVNAIIRKHSSDLLGKRLTDELFGVPREDLEVVIAKGVGLMHHEVPARYARMKQLVGEAWDMAEAMTDRVAHLTRRTS